MAQVGLVLMNDLGTRNPTHLRTNAGTRAGTRSVPPVDVPVHVPRSRIYVMINQTENSSLTSSSPLCNADYEYIFSEMVKEPETGKEDAKEICDVRPSSMIYKGKHLKRHLTRPDTRLPQ